KMSFIRTFLSSLLVLMVLAAAAAQSSIAIDGSSTVYPISLAMAEEFSIENPDVGVSVGFSGSGAGFTKLCAGEIDIADASRVIRQSELDTCAANGIEVIELPVAADALTVVVNPGNDWAQCMTIEELHTLWGPESSVSHWNQLRPEWPAVPITLYGPGTD